MVWIESRRSESDGEPYQEFKDKNIYFKMATNYVSVAIRTAIGLIRPPNRLFNCFNV